MEMYLCWKKMRNRRENLAALLTLRVYPLEVKRCCEMANSIPALTSLYSHGLAGVNQRLYLYHCETCTKKTSAHTIQSKCEILDLSCFRKRTSQVCNLWIYFYLIPGNSQCPFPCGRETHQHHNRTSIFIIFFLDLWTRETDPPVPDFRSPRQSFGERHPLWWRLRNRRRHHLVPLQRESLRLYRVIIVIVVVLILTWVVCLVRILFVECVKVVLFDQRLCKHLNIFISPTGGKCTLLQLKYRGRNRNILNKRQAQNIKR